MKNFKLLMMMVMIVPVVMRADDKRPDKERVLIDNHYGAAIHFKGKYEDKDKNEHEMEHQIEAGKQWTWIAQESGDKLQGFEVIDQKEYTTIVATTSTAAVLTFGVGSLGAAALPTYTTKQKVEDGNNVFTLTAGPVIKSSDVKKVIITPSKASTTASSSSTDVTDSDSSTTTDTSSTGAADTGDVKQDRKDKKDKKKHNRGSDSSSTTTDSSDSTTTTDSSSN